MIENDTEKALKTLIENAITDEDLECYIGERSEAMKKGKRVLIYSTDAISKNPSITNVFELTVSVILQMNSRENTEPQMEARADEILSVVTDPDLPANLNTEMSEGEVITARLYDLRREAVDGMWSRSANIRLVFATS